MSEKPDGQSGASSSARFIGVAFVALAVIAGFLFGRHWWQVGRHMESTDNAYVQADVSRISSRVAGQVTQLPIHEHQAVKQGELLTVLDSAEYAAHLDSAQAALIAARAAVTEIDQKIKLQGSTITEARASLSASRVQQAQLEKNLQRARQLLDKGIVTGEHLEITQASHDAGQFGVLRQQAALRGADQQIPALVAERERLLGMVNSQEAAVTLARLDFESTTIRAPVDGVVGDLAIHLGERVAINQRLLSLVPLDRIYVEANYKETQLGHMREGQNARIRLDAFEGVEMDGVVQSFSPASGSKFSLLPPQNATGNFTKIVQRVPVRITLKLPAELQGRVRPGMSVEATVDTRNNQDGD